MDENDLGKSDWRIFKSSLRLEQIDEAADLLYFGTHSWISKVN